MRKYLNSNDTSIDEAFFSKGNDGGYSRLVSILSDHIDDYLATGQTRSVKVLEDQLWTIADI